MLSLVALVAPQASQADGTHLATTIVAKSFQFYGVPSQLPAGSYDTRFFNISRVDAHEFVALNLGSCASQVTNNQQAIAFLDRLDSDEAFSNACPDGAFEGFAFAPPLGRDRETIEFTPGRTLYFCGIPNAQGVPHYKLGLIGLTNVRRISVG